MRALRLAELFALSGIAVAQPLFDTLAKNSELFVRYETSTREAVLLVVLVVAGPPLAAFGIELAATAAIRRHNEWIHGVVGGGFGGLLAVEVAANVVSPNRAVLAAAAAVGFVGTAMLLARVEVARQFLRILAVAPAIFAVLFLAFSPATDVLFAASTGARDVEVERPERVVFVLLDELPLMSLLDGEGAVDAELFPNFAALAGTSTWYRNSASVAAFTEGAVPALLSGQYPDDASKPATAAAYPDNLFTLLGNTYDMNVVETVTRLCPERLCDAPPAGDFRDMLATGLDLWTDFVLADEKFDATAAATAWRTALQTTRRFTAGLARPVDEPRVDLLHVELPHYPWHVLPSLQQHPVEPGYPPGEAYFETATSELGLIGARTRHLLQVQAVDTIVGRIVTALRDSREYDDALVVVTADHGVAFTIGEPVRNPSAGNYHEILWTPLFMKFPGQTSGTVDDRPARSIDVLPTILDSIGARLPDGVEAGFDGASLLGPAPTADGAEPHRVYPWTWLGQPKDLRPDDGESYVEVERASAFDRVLAAHAVPATGNPALRVYRNGEYSDLLGRSVADLEVEPTPEGGADPSTIASVRIDDAEKFDAIDPTAAVIPWAWNVGLTYGLEPGTDLAIAVDGVVVATSGVQNALGGVAPFSFAVPPALVDAGPARVQVFSLAGPPAAPVLTLLEDAPAG